MREQARHVIESHPRPYMAMRSEPCETVPLAAPCLRFVPQQWRGVDEALGQVLAAVCRHKRAKLCHRMFKAPPCTENGAHFWMAAQ